MQLRVPADRRSTEVPHERVQRGIEQPRSVEASSAASRVSACSQRLSPRVCPRPASLRSQVFALDSSRRHRPRTPATPRPRAAAGRRASPSYADASSSMRAPRDTPRTTPRTYASPSGGSIRPSRTPHRTSAQLPHRLRHAAGRAPGSRRRRGRERPHRIDVVREPGSLAARRRSARSARRSCGRWRFRPRRARRHASGPTAGRADAPAERLEFPRGRLRALPPLGLLQRDHLLAHARGIGRPGQSVEEAHATRATRRACSTASTCLQGPRSLGASRTRHTCSARSPARRGRGTRRRRFARSRSRRRPAALHPARTALAHRAGGVHLLERAAVVR